MGKLLAGKRPLFLDYHALAHRISDGAGPNVSPA